MDSKTVKLNCLTLGELENEHISKKKWSVPLIEKCTYTDYIIREDLYFFIFLGFQAFCRYISYVCELVHCCDAPHSRRLYETTESTSKNDGSF